MENNKQNATLFIYQWVDENVVPDDTGKLSDMLIAYGNKLNIPDVSGSSYPDDFWKQEYDEAVKEIGNLQDQLKDAESAIRDMESELRSRY